MISCVRTIQFSYGHRILGHENKCASLHGHNGRVEIYATPVDGLDSAGRVIDFSVLKRLIGGWIEENWDHTMILSSEDEETFLLLKQAPMQKAVFLLPGNPTAENLAQYLFWEICPKLLGRSGIIINKVVFWETENCRAEEALDIGDAKLRELYGVYTE